MNAIRPNDFYRCIMSPNMMLARTRPLQFQQGPFFIPWQYKKRTIAVMCRTGDSAHSVVLKMFYIFTLIMLFKLLKLTNIYYK
ncbi:hypothetical protein CRG94_11995 [Escherichia sp. E3356]|nr:hypothetical protein CRI66_21070 [Escherichia sp. E4694]TGB94309.1 hypothetical protein CRG94_11995 [Escherichia sp. E3356]